MPASAGSSTPGAAIMCSTRTKGQNQEPQAIDTRILVDSAGVRSPFSMFASQGEQHMASIPLIHRMRQRRAIESQALFLVAAPRAGAAALCTLLVGADRTATLDMAGRQRFEALLAAHHRADS